MSEGVYEQKQDASVSQEHLYNRRREFTSSERVKFQVDEQMAR